MTERTAELLPDADARRVALTDFGHNLVVTAGAGTGKTSLLVGRLLAALLTQHFQPGRCLAVTFTENAAAEMRERLLRLLRTVPGYVRGDAVDEGDGYVLRTLGLGPEHVRRAEELLEEVDSLQVSTFHGFCIRLLQEQAAALDLPARIHPGDLERVRAAFDSDFVAFLDQAADGEHADALERFEAHELRQLAWELSALPEESWALVQERFVPSDLRSRARQLDDLRVRYPQARPDWRRHAEALAELYSEVLRPLAASARADRSVLRRQWVPKAGKRELGADDPVATEALQEHHEFLRGLLDADELAVQKACAFVRPFLAEQRRRRAHSGDLAFDDLLLLTRRALLDGDRLRRRLARRFDTILVDEFQDTDPLQYDILLLLASDPERAAEGPVRDPFALPLRPCLFIVGDAKQSIYRFRRADVSAYFRAVQRITGPDAGAPGRLLVLRANFRSRPEVLDFVNAVCGASMREQLPYQLGYEPVAATRAASPGAGPVVDVVLLPAAAGSGAARRRGREGRAIPSVLAELHRDGVPFARMAILLRAATDVTWLLRPLRQSGIPYVVQGSRRFYSRHEVVLAGALLAAMARPYDPVPVLAVLRSAWSRATDGELLAWRQAGRSLDYRLATDDGGAVGEAMARLRELHERARAQASVADALTLLLRLPEWLLLEAGGFEGAQRIANLERLLTQLLEAMPLDLAAAAALVERRSFAETEDEESPLFEQAGDAVRILTAHGAKGLEFDAVVIPDIARRPRGEDDGRISAQRSFTAEGDELVAVRVGGAGNVASAYARREARPHSDAEERRLFYVAATRARERLVLVGHDDDALTQDSVWQRDLLANMLEAMPRVRVRRDSLAAPVAAAGGDGGGDVDPTLAAHARFQALQVRLAQATRRGAARPSDGGSGPAAGDPEARQLGSAAHRYLALVDFARREVDDDLFARCGCPPAQRDRLRRALAALHTSDELAAIRAARRVEREVPVSWRDRDGRAAQGVVDVALEDRDGAWHVIDWKTDRVPDPGRHRGQLEAYAAGLRAALGLDRSPTARACFLFPDLAG